MSRRRLVFSLILKIIVFVSAAVGIPMSALADARGFMAGKTVFMFFTVQSNILMALVCLIGAILLIKGTKIDPRWYVFKYVSTVAITLTGVVFCFVLAPTLGPLAWNVQNILTHVVVPLAAIADFYVSGLEARLRRKHISLVIIPPILYAIYAGIGFVYNWQFAPGFNYPYFFLNWGSPAG
ncbi:MAG: Pr6Pr family membrane protein, partial [Lachnospiraceae bacterium]|nr:Pr6Pr family membrane protein [Lachnospiraceae bacterium]